MGIFTLACASFPSLCYSSLYSIQFLWSISNSSIVYLWTLSSKCELYGRTFSIGKCTYAMDSILRCDLMKIDPAKKEQEHKYCVRNKSRTILTFKLFRGYFSHVKFEFEMCHYISIFLFLNRITGTEYAEIKTNKVYDWNWTFMVCVE